MKLGHDKESVVGTKALIVNDNIEGSASTTALIILIILLIFIWAYFSGILTTNI